MNKFPNTPLKTMAALFGVWLGLFLLNYLLLRGLDLKTGTTWLFPLTQFIGPALQWDGLPYGAVFLAVFIFSVKKVGNWPIWAAWLAGLVLIFLGNLCQGSWEAAFHHPFTAHGMQYYSDALKVEEPLAWLAQFNQIQPDLLIHSKTHPPFAVLIHCWGGLNFQALIFTLASSLALLFIGDCFKTLGNPRASSMVLLFALIPAVNIYTAVSLDGLLAMSASAAVAGMLRMLKGERSHQAVLFFTSGLVTMNLLSFGGTFLLLTSLIVAVVAARRGDPFLLKMFAGNAVLGLASLAVLHWGLGYNHFQAFFTASHLENPNGFLAFHAPLAYVMTRLADVTEIALFFSPAALAFLFHLKRDFWKGESGLVSLAGLVTLGLMFLTGAFRVGETARACLFIYPFLVLGFHTLNERQLKITLWYAGGATLIMQLMGGYVW